VHGVVVTGQGIRPAVNLDVKSIAELAYQLWVARGRPHGSGEVDWLEAERQLSKPSAAAPTEINAKVEASLKDTFPASDPPSSHIPDHPPSNADAKWKAAGIKRVERT
jgi:hypothetical protein